MVRDLDLEECSSLYQSHHHCEGGGGPAGISANVQSFCSPRTLLGEDENRRIVLGLSVEARESISIGGSHPCLCKPATD